MYWGYPCVIECHLSLTKESDDQKYAPEQLLEINKQIMKSRKVTAVFG